MHCEEIQLPVHMYCNACLIELSKREDHLALRGELQLTLLNHLIRSGGEIDKIKILLDNGAIKAINKGCKYGITPLYNAMIYNTAEVIEWIIDNYSDVIDYSHRDRNGQNIIHFFSRTCSYNVKQIEYFFEKLSENIIKHLINEKDAEGNTPIIIAYLSKNYNLVKILIDYGANPSIQNDRGESVISMETSGHQPPYVMEYMDSFLKTPDI